MHQSAPYRLFRWLLAPTFPAVREDTKIEVIEAVSIEAIFVVLSHMKKGIERMSAQVETIKNELTALTAAVGNVIQKLSHNSKLVADAQAAVAAAQALSDAAVADNASVGDVAAQRRWQAVRSHLFMVRVDSIVADGSLDNMANYRRYGFECCGGGNIVAETEAFLPALDDLATLAAEHAHHYFRSQIVAVENNGFGKHPREIFWPVEDGVEIHSVFIHPLFTSASALQQYARRHFANIDHGMIPRMFTDSRTIKIIEDPREAYVNNFTAAARLYETTG